MKTKYILYFAVVLFLASSCKPEVNDFTPDAGSADFSTYVAVGNSLTAGYADGALYKSGQSYGWANILSAQLKQSGGGDFVLPVIESEQGVLPGKLVLGPSTDCLGNVSLGPVPANDGDLDPWNNHIDYAINNLGVPGAKVGHLLFPGYGNPANLPAGLANPYFVKFASTPDITVLEQALSMQPTFISLWIGNNDVLGYATSGGAGSEITPVADFAGQYGYLAQNLFAGGSEGILANIPDIANAAFFTTVPYNPIVLTDQVLVDQLNTAYAPYNAAMASLGLPYRVNWSLGANPMVIVDKDMGMPVPEFNIRQIESNELVLLTIPQDSIKCAQWGSAKPIPDQYVLTVKEIKNVNDATEQFNNIIKQTAQDLNLAFADFNSLMKQMQGTGLVYDGITFTTAFVYGNLFSLDGIHLSPQGNAVVANYYIDAINATYGANVPKVNISDYPPITLP
ncbi:MAG: hypothetical protein DRI89_08490 [Bacteroidetes bacterium]|nr:MAG: hypothetical protein DRI89_08490 [Bacteroidota bacterium]